MSKVVRAKPKLVQDMVTWKLNNAGCLKLELTFFGKRGTRITDASLLFGSQFARVRGFEAMVVWHSVPSFCCACCDFVAGFARLRLVLCET